MQTYTFNQSQALFERAAKVIPCGIYGHLSPAPLVPPTSYPFYAVRGAGSHFVDADGNDFIDYMCAYGPMVLGYNNKVVDKAVLRQLKDGDTLAAPAPIMVELAEYLVDLIPFAAWAYFAKNGGDVTTYATMIARAATGRPKIVAIKEGYHGVAAWMQGGGHHGVVDADVRNVIRVPWNDAAAFERTLQENPGQIAGFISTPYHHPTFEDSQLPAEGYWQRIEALCRKNGVVLIVDDVRCGFRHDLRGSHECFGFTPDLVCFCKAIGNGYPISALVGCEELKGDAAKVFYTGSYWFQAAPMAAALATLKELVRLDGPRMMGEYGRKLTDGMVRMAADHGFHLRVTGMPSMPFVRLTDDESLMLHQRFCSECTRRGAYLTSHHNWFMSCAHTAADMQRTWDIVEDVLKKLEKEGALMPLSPEEIRSLQAKARELRCLMVDVTVWAGGAHIGGSLSAADILTALYFKYLRIRPEEPDWADRDRFVLSKGHGGVGLASVLADRGYFPKDLLHEFNHFKSPFGMHLDGNKVPGVDASTGSLGHGLSMAVGMALGARLQGKGWLTYCLLGDGECNEGSVWEAAMAASHHKVDNLITIVDRNRFMIDGPTEDVMGLEPFAEKWRAFGWVVTEIDGHDFAQIGEAVEAAQLAKGAPMVIVAHTVKGKGVDFMENAVQWHYGSVDSELAARAKASIQGGA